MTKDPLIIYQNRLRASQLEALRKIATDDIPIAIHIRRAVDMYLSQPAIMEALVELEKPDEAPEYPLFPCSTPALDKHCSGCTDPRSEGTHQGCTVEHGHVGCELVAGLQEGK